MARTRTLFPGAAGRDFHDFNVLFRADASRNVVAFTVQQIPGIAGRRYPASLYPEGITIHTEDQPAIDGFGRAAAAVGEFPTAAAWASRL